MSNKLRWIWVVPLLALLTLLAGCGQSSGSVAGLPSGWSWHHDDHYPFDAPVPPQWSVASFTNTQSPGDECEYTVNFFPPGREAISERAASELEPELIAITVKGSCPLADPSHDTDWTPEAGRINVGGTMCTVYDRAPEPDRMVVATFGGHQYLFYMQSPANTAQRDEMLFKQMLERFRYTGK
ncbi:MAG: hypothetical protein OJF49_004127 [Ktedonobacterales bacterium]|jgi:hypothetical protein|nr:MAG: hypothetical protein OJF49_004127 [Ktedonobacterales bacterium]